VDKGKIKRLEYRANEFSNYSTFRMIAESQRLAAMFFSYLKETNDIEINELEGKLSDLWVKFSEGFQEVCKKYKIQKFNLVDHKKEYLCDLLEKTDLQKDCRNLITEFSKKAMLEIKGHYKEKE
jgi:hypothetical protein